MDLNNIRKVTNSLSELIENNEKIALALFSAKLAKASEIYPEDQTIGVMADVTSRMANGKKLFITRAEIKDLYNRLYSRNTKFAELFKDELGQVERPKPAKIMQHNDTVVDMGYDKIVDPILTSALNSAFGNKSRGFVGVAAENAKKVCLKKCSELGAKINIVSGNESFVICRAEFETPKGQTSVFIPVEVSGEKALIPSIFVGNTGAIELTKENLQEYIESNTGNKLNINENIVFAAIENAKGKNIEKVSSVDLAVIKHNATKETNVEYISNGIYFQKIEADDKNIVVKTAEYKDNEIESFSKSFDSAIGLAKFKFGDSVKLGRTIISSKLNSFGLKDHQISVFSSDDLQIVYAVSLNGCKLAFRVPVKVVGNKLLDPVLLISNGAVESFSKEGLENLFKKDSIDYKTAAVASPLYGLKASELVQAVRTAMMEENYAKAEDALNVLSESGDDKAYNIAFSEYTNGLNGVKEVESKCNMVVRNSSSKHPLCGHTGLPLHKVSQDKQGNCIPNYRKGMQDTREGAYFLNSKIFF